MGQVFDAEQRRRIAGTARTLFERDDGVSNVEDDEVEEEYVDDLLAEWRDTFEDGGQFQQRLDADGFTEARCRQLVREATWPADEPLPEWVRRVEGLVADVQARSPADVEFGQDRRDERPFGQFFGAIVEETRNRLPADRCRALSATALDSLQRWLHRRLHGSFVRVLYVEFKTFVTLRDRDLGFADPEKFEDPPREYYQQFVEHLHDGGFADLCVEYPVFARLLATRTRQWEAFVVELAEVIEADGEALGKRFADGDELGDVTDVEPLAEDTHGDGRAVTRVTFDAETTVVYKPRSVDAGVAFYELLDRLDEHLDVPSFRSPTYLPREDYGWMSWVERADCPDEAAVTRYYERAGALLAVGYVLGFSDCQLENVIARGEYPTIVDAETVFHPYPEPEREVRPTALARYVNDTVLLTALLPLSINMAHDPGDADQPKLAGFGLDSSETQLSDYRHPKIVATNTDVMNLEFVHPKIDREANVPQLDGRDQPPTEYVAPLVDGFETTYETLADLDETGQLLDEIGLYDLFEDVENRLVYRSTHRYASVITSLSSRACLQDGARLAIEMEGLATSFFDGTVEDLALWPIYEREREALKRLDPPRFTSTAHGTALERNGSEVGTEVETAGVVRSERRLASMGPDDRQTQTRLVRECYESSVVRTESSQDAPVPTDEWFVSPKPVDEPIDGVAVEEATRLFELVTDTAAGTDDPGREWIHQGIYAPTPGLNLELTDTTLYGGTCGIALSAAALYRTTGEESYRTFALETVAPIVDAVDSNSGVRTASGVGAVRGLGSIAYSLGVLGELLDEESLLTDGVAAAGHLSAADVEDDETYDVLGGSAGTILALLGLYDRTGADELLGTAVRCGDHLLAEQVETTAGAAWQHSRNAQPMTGYSHGAAGIAYALQRLADVTDERRFAGAAAAAVAYESAHFSAAERNWSDFREDAAREFMDQWCHGRSGIGLARLGMAKHGAEDALDDARIAYEATPTDWLNPQDVVCCGNFGRVEFLLEAGRTFEGELGAARELVGRVLARKDDYGHFVIPGHGSDLMSPTFFQGCAGLAYTLVRAAEPGSLPCILLWE